MDHNVLAVLLQQTLEKSTRENAETELEKIKKIIGFCPGLLQVVMSANLDQAVRQAGVIYFKNLISTSWVVKEANETIPIPIDPLPFSIHEQDKALIRESIVQAAVMAPEVIRIQLAVCICMIIKHDFPHRWPEVVQKIRYRKQFALFCHWCISIYVMTSKIFQPTHKFTFTFLATIFQARR